MSVYLFERYRLVADELQSAHGLVSTEEIRDLIAKTIMHHRVIPRDRVKRAHTPLPTARKALRHARALHRYGNAPPTKSSIAKRCKSLRAALLGWDGTVEGIDNAEDRGILAVELGILLGDRLNFGVLLDSLKSDKPEAKSLELLVEGLTTIVREPHNWQTIGRPWGRTKSIVRTGHAAWVLAGKHPGYAWCEGDDELTGEFPDFLRDLVACCNGTHDLVASMERACRITPPKRLHNPLKAPKGSGLRVSDKSLQLAIMDCRADENLNAYLEQSKKNERLS